MTPLACSRRAWLGSAASVWAGSAWAGRQDTAPLQLVGPWEVGGLQPAVSGYLFTRLQVAETLMGALDDGTPAAALAEHWHASADGLQWHFRLRPQARFHDGSRVTAAAVVRALRLARTPPSPLAAAPISTIEAVGEQQVLIRLTQPHSSLLARLAHSSTLVLAPAAYRPNGQVQQIIGSGPYRIQALVPPQLIATQRTPTWDGPHPAIDQVRYLCASRAETRALMAEAGQADLAYGLDAPSVRRLRTHPQVHVEQVLLPRTVALKLNAALPALQDLRVRQALSLAIDRQGIATALLRDPALAATQLLPPVLAGWHDPTLPPLQHGLAHARHLLDQAGVATARAPLRLTLRTFPDRPELPWIATALQAQWRAVGVQVQLAIGNSGEIPWQHRQGQLEVALIARHYGNLPDPTATLQADFGPRGGDWGAMGWHDPCLTDALAQLARGALDAANTTLRRRVTTTLQQALPLIPVAWYRQHVAVSQRVQGVRLDPLERSYRLTEMTWQNA